MRTLTAVFLIFLMSAIVARRHFDSIALIVQSSFIVWLALYLRPVVNLRREAIASCADLVVLPKDIIGFDNTSTTTAVFLRHRYELGEESGDFIEASILSVCE